MILSTPTTIPRGKSRFLDGVLINLHEVSLGHSFLGKLQYFRSDPVYINNNYTILKVSMHDYLRMKRISFGG